MRKAFFAAICVIVILVLVICGMIFYSYNQVRISLVDLSFVEIHLEDLSLFDLVNLSLDLMSGNWESIILEVISEIDLGIILELTNNGFFPVYVPDVDYDLSINEIFVGNGSSTVNTVIYPGERKEIDVFQNLQKTSLTPAIKSMIKEQGIITIRVNGTAYIEFFGQSIPLSFENQKQISIIDEILNKINKQ